MPNEARWEINITPGPFQLHVHLPPENSHGRSTRYIFNLLPHCHATISDIFHLVRSDETALCTNRHTACYAKLFIALHHTAHARGLLFGEKRRLSSLASTAIGRVLVRVRALCASQRTIESYKWIGSTPGVSIVPVCAVCLISIIK